MNGKCDLNLEQNAIHRGVMLPNGAILNRFWDENDSPRPESYKEDVGPGVGGGDGVPPPKTGHWIGTVIGSPVLKKPIVALTTNDGALESNRKLYNVPQRIAFAFSLSAKVCELQVSELESWVDGQGTVLNPASPRVPSLAHPGS